MTETKGCHTGLSGACSELCINSDVNVLNLGLSPESRPKARVLPWAYFFCPDNVRSRQVSRSKWPQKALHMGLSRRRVGTNGRRERQEKMGNLGHREMYVYLYELKPSAVCNYMLVKTVVPMNAPSVPLLVKEDIPVRNVGILKVRFVAAKSWSELWCLMPVSQALGRLMKEDYECVISPGCLATL